MPKLTPEDAERLLSGMVDATTDVLNNQAFCPFEVSDQQYDAFREALPPVLADLIEKHIGVGA